MRLKSLDHVNLRTIQFEEMMSFYGDLLGLQACHVPSSGGRAIWLNLDSGGAVLHLIKADHVDYCRAPRIEHFAFKATGLLSFMQKLDDAKIAYNLSFDQALGIVHLNLRDPDDNRLHLDFDSVEYDGVRAPAKVSAR